MEAAARENLNSDTVHAHFKSLDDHQDRWKVLVDGTAKADVTRAWHAITVHLPDFPRVRDNFGRWGDAESLRSLAQATCLFANIALLAIKIVTNDHPFEGDDRVQSLLAVADAVEVGRYHKRLVLEGYANEIREIAEKIQA